MSITIFDTWKVIEEDDAAIEEALKDANVPSLMMALVHLTGETEIVHGDIRPEARNMADPQAGVTEEQQAYVREKALEALKAYRDRGCTLPPPPSEAEVMEMMHCLIGEPIPGDYGEFLIGELSLHGENPYQQPGMDTFPAD